MSDRIWTIEAPDPDKIMLAPADWVIAMVGGTKRRVSRERFRALFPMTVRVHPEVYLAAVAHPLCIDGKFMTPEGVIRLRPDPSLRRLRDIFIDAHKGDA